MPPFNPPESCPQSQVTPDRSAGRFALQYVAIALTAIGVFHASLVALPATTAGSLALSIAASTIIVLGSALAIFFLFRKTLRQFEAAQSMELAATRRADALVRAIPQTLIEVDSDGGIRAFRSQGPGRR